MTVTAPSSLISFGARPPTRPGGRLGCRLVELARALHHAQYQLVITAAAFADSGEWAAEGATSAGAWLAAIADVEAATAREWIRIGRQLNQLPVIAAEFAAGRLSYAKVRTLTRVATAESEVELAVLARTVPASGLGCALAGWHNSATPVRPLPPTTPPPNANTTPQHQHASTAHCRTPPVRHSHYCVLHQPEPESAAWRPNPGPIQHLESLRPRHTVNHSQWRQTRRLMATSAHFSVATDIGPRHLDSDHHGRLQVGSPTKDVR